MRSCNSVFGVYFLVLFFGISCGWKSGFSHTKEVEEFFSGSGNACRLSDWSCIGGKHRRGEYLDQVSISILGSALQIKLSLFMILKSNPHVLRLYMGR